MAYEAETDFSDVWCLKYIHVHMMDPNCTLFEEDEVFWFYADIHKVSASHDLYIALHQRAVYHCYIDDYRGIRGETVAPSWEGSQATPATWQKISFCQDMVKFPGRSIDRRGLHT